MAQRAQGTGLGFSLAGFPVEVPANTLIGVALIAYLWAPQFRSDSLIQQWTLAISFAVLLLASVLIHELAHAIAARRYGYPVQGITLWAFGGFTSYRPGRSSPGREAVIAFAGPAATLLIAAVGWALLRIIPTDLGMTAQFVAAVVWANAFVGLFNLLPGLPLDGGALVSSLVWKLTGSRARGQAVAAYVGMGLAALLVALPFLTAWANSRAVDLPLLLISLLLAGFLFLGAKSALDNSRAASQFGNSTALDLGIPATVIPSTWTVAALQDHLKTLPPSPRGLVALLADGEQVVGIVVPDAMAAVPSTAYPTMPVTAVARSVTRWTRLPADAPATEVSAVLQHSSDPILLVGADDLTVVGAILPAGSAQ